MEPVFSPDQHHELKCLIRRSLQGLKEDSPLVYTVEQASEKLQMSKSKVYELARRKDLPAVKIGGRVMFPRQRLEDWLNEQAE